MLSILMDRIIAFDVLYFALSNSSMNRRHYCLVSLWKSMKAEMSKHENVIVIGANKWTFFHKIIAWIYSNWRALSMTMTKLYRVISSFYISNGRHFSLCVRIFYTEIVHWTMAKSNGERFCNFLCDIEWNWRSFWIHRLNDWIEQFTLFEWTWECECKKCMGFCRASSREIQNPENLINTFTFSVLIRNLYDKYTLFAGDVRELTGKWCFSLKFFMEYCLDTRHQQQNKHINTFCAMSCHLPMILYVCRVFVKMDENVLIYEKLSICRCNMQLLKLTTFTSWMCWKLSFKSWVKV